MYYPAGIYLLKVNIISTRTRYEISLKLTIKTPERHSSVFIVNFEHLIPGWNFSLAQNKRKFEHLFKGMLRRNIEYFLKKRKYEKLRFSEILFSYFKRSLFLIFLKI